MPQNYTPLTADILAELEKKQKNFATKELIKANFLLDAKMKEASDSGSHMKAYIVSVIMPPMGVFYFFKYLIFCQEKDRSVKAAVMSLLLTVTSFVVSIVGFAIFMKQVQLAPNSQSSDFLKEMTNPANQRDLINLMK